MWIFDRLQGFAGGSYAMRDGFRVTFAVLGGSHEASPKIGAHAGFEVDFPAVVRGTVRRNAVLQTARAKHGFADTLKTSLMRRLP